MSDRLRLGLQRGKFFLAALALCLAACGGGGGDVASASTGQAPQPTGFNVDAAFTSLLTQSWSFPNLQGTRTELFGTASVVVTESDTFQPQPGSSTTVRTIVSSISSSPNTPTTSTEIFQYSVAPLTISSITRGGSALPYQLVAPLPTSAQLGASGNYETTGAGRIDWRVLAADSADTAWACLDSSSGGINNSSNSICLNIDMEGHVRRASFGYSGGFQFAGYTVQ